MPSLNGGFTNWDDDKQITKNLAVRSLSFENIKHIFSPESKAQDIFVPLTIFSYAIEYHFVKYEPFLYHLDNLLLHTCVTLLVFFLGLQLGLAWQGALLAAVIFCIHPMRVESVAWLTGRKDVLFASFYVGALICHCKYIRAKSWVFFVLSVFCGFLSILAKPSALTLVFSLLLIDWMFQRKNYVKMFGEKIFHLIGAVWIASLTVIPNADVLSLSIDLSKAALILAWSCMFYISKFFWPQTLLPIYEPSNPIFLTQPIYLFSVIGFLSFIVSLIIFRKHRWYLFAGLFFLSTICIFLRYDVRNYPSWVADRYMYIPSLGFCLFFGYLWVLFDKKILAKPLIKRASIGGIFIIVFLLSVQSFRYSGVWKDSLSLWSYMIEKKPKEYRAYNNRGLAYHSDNKINLALQDYNKVLEINPMHAKTYVNRSVIFNKLEQKPYPFAQRDLRIAIELKPDFYQAYYNRAHLLHEVGELDKAIEDLNKTIELKPNLYLAYNNRGIIFMEQQKLDLALADFSQAIQINANYVDAINNRGMVYEKKKLYEEALKDFYFVSQLKGFSVVGYRNMASVHIKMGNNELARVSLDKIVRLQPDLAFTYFARSELFIQAKQLNAALKDLSRYISLKPEDSRAYFNRALVLKELGNLKESIQDLKQARALGLSVKESLINEFSALVEE